MGVRRPPRTEPPDIVKSLSIASNDSKTWIIVAPRQDEDVVNYLRDRATTIGVKIGRVIWTDQGPLRCYSSADELWDDLLTG